MSDRERSQYTTRPYRGAGSVSQPYDMEDIFPVRDTLSVEMAVLAQLGANAVASALSASGRVPRRKRV